jgi:hypothetical protein
MHRYCIYIIGIDAYCIVLYVGLAKIDCILSSARLPEPMI